MLQQLGLALAIVFCALSALHWYWVVAGVGGVAGGGAALPEVGGKPAFQPGRAVTALVATALAAAALTVLLCARLVSTGLPTWVSLWGTVVLGALFLLRAIGEFRLVGFFKRVRGTRFARWDTWLFSPLCVAIGLSCLWLARLSGAR